MSRRRLAGFAAAIAGLPLLAWFLKFAGLTLTDDILIVLAAVVGVALVGGLWPALLAAVGGFLLLNYFFTPPLHTLTVATEANLVALAVFVLVALAVSWVVDLAARRTAQARTLATLAGSVLRGADPLNALLQQLLDTFRLDSVTLNEGSQVLASVRASAGSAGAVWEKLPVDDDHWLFLMGPRISAGDRRIVAAFAAQAAVALHQQRLAAAAEGDRVRTALLAAVSHDLRTPLASAKAAVAGLRSPGVAFGEQDRAELLATAEESLDRLTALVANLLDMSRLQAGALGMTPAEIGLEDVVPKALDELGEAGRRVTVLIPDDLPAIVADPGLLDRVLVNVIGNALRYSPPVIGGRECGDRVELLVVDHGPGVPAADRERIFQPFQRLGDRDNGTGVGLGLALSRGLIEAMGGTITPEDTPGGGLTMVIALPKAQL
jgi:two-component system sensor histidine kinase KdpD